MTSNIINGYKPYMQAIFYLDHIVILNCNYIIVIADLMVDLPTIKD